MEIALEQNRNLLERKRAEAALATPSPALTTTRKDRAMADPFLSQSIQEIARGANVQLPTCAYCGDVATTKDHVVPWSLFHNHRTVTRRNHEGGWMVPACLECNTSLSDLMFVTVPDRAAYLLKRFKTKWRKTLRLPDWRADEIEETAGNFRRLVSTIGPTKEFLRQRLEHLELVASMDRDHLRPEG